MLTGRGNSACSILARAARCGNQWIMQAPPMAAISTSTTSTTVQAGKVGKEQAVFPSAAFTTAWISATLTVASPVTAQGESTLILHAAPAVTPFRLTPWVPTSVAAIIPVRGRDAVPMVVKVTGTVASTPSARATGAAVPATRIVPVTGLAESVSVGTAATAAPAVAVPIVEPAGGAMVHWTATMFCPVAPASVIVTEADWPATMDAGQVGVMVVVWPYAATQSRSSASRFMVLILALLQFSDFSPAVCRILLSASGRFCVLQSAP